MAEFFFLALIELAGRGNHFISDTVGAELLEPVRCELDIHEKLGTKLVPESFDIAIIVVLLHKFVGNLFQQIEDIFLDTIFEKRFAPSCIDHFALLVHHVVILQQPLANAKVILLHLFLRPFHRAGNQRMLNDFAFLQSHPFHDTRNPVAAEQSHQVIFQRKEKL